jgi:nitrogenase molybdenum-iron protein alpha/beta subunit
MNLNRLPSNFSRFGGCTLTGALSVTTHVRDTVSIVHGPKGCSHHNFSLLHATGLDNDHITIPEIVSTGLSETDIVFGGEDALLRTLTSVTERDVSAVFVLSTCIIDTIGDDVSGVCGRDYGIPIIPVPTGGFLGGTFQNGLNNALTALAGIAEPCRGNAGVNIIGEMNLEYEVEENYAEIVRLLSELGRGINCRFVHDIPFDRIAMLGGARLNILRHPELIPVGEFLQQRFGIPFIPSFPVGFSDTLVFIRAVAEACGCDGRDTIDKERALQEKIIADFADLSGSEVFFNHSATRSEAAPAAVEAARMLNMEIRNNGYGFSLAINPAVGTYGVKRMLHRWRRAINA